MHHLLEKIVAHAVQHHVDGERTALFRLFGDELIPPFRVVGETVLSFGGDVFKLLTIEFIEVIMDCDQRPVQRPGRRPRIALVALVVEHTLAPPPLAGQLNAMTSTP